MKYRNLDYQNRVLNRLAEWAYRKGGLPQMKVSLDRAMEHIWTALDTVNP